MSEKTYKTETNRTELSKALKELCDPVLEAMLNPESEFSGAVRDGLIVKNGQIYNYFFEQLKKPISVLPLDTTEDLLGYLLAEKFLECYRDSLQQLKAMKGMGSAMDRIIMMLEGRE